MDDGEPSAPIYAQHLTICNQRGLHARASARFVQTAECFDAQITVSRDGVSVGGTSIMGLMMLSAGPGSRVVVQAHGRQAREALEAITRLVETGFGEDTDQGQALGNIADSKI